MERQYLEIRAGRKAIFESDKLGEHGVDIDLELDRVDEALHLDSTEEVL